MKSLKLRKIVAATVAAVTIATLSPVAASAEWRQDSNGWWNTEGNSYSIGWRNVENIWYYFGSDGYMKTGWVKDGSTWYYLQPSGAMKTGWVNDGGTWYFLEGSGAMKTGWINDNGVWYFASASGAMQTGVIQVDGKVYYLASNGAMQKGTVTIDGKVYTFALSGEAIGDKIPTPKLAFKSSGVSVEIPTDTEETPVVNHVSSGGGGGGKPTTENLINKTYAQDAKIPAITPVDNHDGTATIEPKIAFKSELGQPEKTVTIGTDTYVVKKDITVSLDDGTDVGITQTGLAQYKVEKGSKGTVTAVISLLNTKTGQLYYVESTSTPFQA
ncbi:N-acetylmuramoyl-L-alanine amidase family protein [Clostridium chromiireducens]|uniref:N-acetylmuramoyl-L-alanine amidase family protein n=1 Tax=Clostridium chromiireducens TaxID=225345 RepID=A0A399IPU6_9CLOT|nr:N-acetylmuramoyl-L-alanine amidase family protein [Clostridium chromiireducens]RII35045.1 N-acetylmuramoyl-L-alanine amidase family protein [Clostridium chromiireducens]